MLKDGYVGPHHVSGPALQDPGTAAIVEKITVREDPRHSARFPEGRWSDLTITLKNGQRLDSGDVHARGGPEAPMKPAEIKTKFETMTHAQIGAERSETIW